MKLYILTIKVIIIVIIIVGMNLNPGCKDPHDYEPPTDTLVNPPNEIPEILFPPDDTHFVFGQQGHGWDTIWVSFQWTGVTDAQYYDVEISRYSHFPDSMSWTQRATDSFYIWALGAMNCHWHVRAGSDKWTWFTGWSEPGNFQLVYPPFQ